MADTPEGQAWVDDTIEEKVSGYGFPRPSAPGENGCPEKPKVIYADPKKAQPAPKPKPTKKFMGWLREKAPK